MNSHTRNPLTVWNVFVSVHLSSHCVECICQCTVVPSLCGKYLAVYSCPLTVWNVFVSVQLSSHCVECICHCTVVLSHLSVYSCMYRVNLGEFSCGRLQQRMILEC